ncbi:DUF2507 domain containing protein [Exiguobacterium sp. S17]|nr:DUF2507 domain containing protein [Exiguobacterium sp. S17]
METMSQPTFAIELLRDYVLTDLLGDDYAQVIYWSGKRVARKFPTMPNEELSAFFSEAGWGELTLVKEKGNKFVFELTPPPATQAKANGYYQLEAGFLAEQIAGRFQCVAEGYADPGRQAVHITVQLDQKDTYE